MGTDILNGNDYQKMLLSGLAQLNERYREVDLLNVFPVPDGDTGTNMYLTLSAAVNEVARGKCSSSIGEVAELASMGSLMGARGNSGVILSRLFRGFAKAVKDMNQISGKVFAQALNEGVNLAVKAVLKPVEGTILTVGRAAAKEAISASEKKHSMEKILMDTCIAAEKTLNLTPEMLPVLKEAGVVDAGGMGWLIILKGFYLSLQSSETDLFDKASEAPAPKPVTVNTGISIDLKFPYCTELLIRSVVSDYSLLKESLEKIGDSFVFVDSDGLIKVHIHTAKPGLVLENCLKYGPIFDVKINNMDEQSANALVKIEKKPFGVVSVSVGDGITRIMKSLGADEVILGGQSMNPSAKEILLAVEKVNSETVLILPNNSNIMLTAGQVSGLTNKKVVVIPSKTIPQGLAALLSINPMMETETMINSLNSAISSVKTGEVTYAVRDTLVNSKKVAKGDIIGLSDGEILEVGSDISNTVINLMKKMITPDNEICSIYFGNLVTTENANNLFQELENSFPDLEFDLHYGGQPLYYYIISVE